MKLVSLTMPEDSDLLAGWLEQHLVGLDLGALVAELRAIHSDTNPLSLAELLHTERDAVLSRGLSALSTDHLRQLLRSPELLLDLQELVLTEGGPYWHRLPRSVELTLAVARGRDDCCAEAAAASTPPLRVAWYRRSWVISLTSAAAAAVLTVGLLHWLNPTPEGTITPPVAVVPPASAPSWGFDRPEALPRDGSARAYLGAVADAAREWFKNQPDTAPALAQRLGEFRRGCTTLIFASHKPLAKPERLWLVKNCREWAKEIDRALIDLEGGARVEVVRGEMDRTVEELVGDLRKKAEKLKG